MNDKSGLQNDMRHANGGKIVRLIDADALLENRENFVSSTWGLAIAISDIEEADVVDAEPVRHGRWKYDTNTNDWGIGGYVCSECGAKNNNLPCNKVANLMMFVGSNYCPHCGARMGMEEEE